MGELRDRMQQDLILHGMAPRTQQSYVAAVRGLAKYYPHQPDTLSEAQVQTYVRYLIEQRGLAPSSVRVAVMGLRFFYPQTLHRPWTNLPLPKRTKTLPEVLSREEVARLLASTTTVRERALLMTTYGGGLRVSEVVRLRVSDIDAGRGMLRVEQGKGRKDRSTLLGPRLLGELRHYWQVYRPTPPWLFPQRTNPGPMDTSPAQKIYYAAKARAGITKAGGIHALRHAFTTHLLEGGADLATRQRLLGHESGTTTRHYVHVARSHLTAHGSPLESLPDVSAVGYPMPPRSSPPTATGLVAHPSPPPFEVADIVRAYGATFRETHPVSHEQARVLRAIAPCRTAVLGGHVEQCATCGTDRGCYDSCRNRHCPKCQGSARAKGLAAAQALLLPVLYCHVVFTLPPHLNPLIRVNPRRLYDLLFQTAAQPLQEFARDPQHLGAELGITAVLHTWGQTLTEHVHVHCVVTGGGVSLDGTQWRRGRRRFLFAVKALGHVFRGKYLAGLDRLRMQHRLTFAGESGPLVEDSAWSAFRQHLHAKPWVVYAKPPWGSPEHVLKYLSRSTHRVAIANSRLGFVGDGVVRFQYKDYATQGSPKLMELPATEFLRRFLRHVVPSGFVRIRHYGLLAHRTRQEKLARARQLLAGVAAAVVPLLLPTTTSDPPPATARCPHCAGSHWRIITLLAPQRGPP